jgi:ribosomal protein S18 acetylase RimI-like enzyme
MQKADLPAVGLLAGRLVRAHHEYDPLRFIKPVDPERGYVRWFETQLEVDEAILLVAEDEDGIVGYVYARMEPRSYNELLDACTKLHDIFVAERGRRRGVGEALLRETFRRAKAKGAPRVVLLTASQNTGAHRLFHRMGFRTTMLEMTAELVEQPQQVAATKMKTVSPRGKSLA